MLENLKVINLPAEAIASHGFDVPKDAFELKTCQRQLFAYIDEKSSVKESHYLFKGVSAYEFLLQVITGLQSDLIGETEIVAQFKDAYLSYLESPDRASRVIKTLEKLFHDAKKLRHDYLRELGQLSYSGLTKKLLGQNKLLSRSEKVLILGSGKLAKDLVKVLSKKFQIAITARNTQRVREIQEQFSDVKVAHIPWEDRTSWSHYPAIVCTIGAEEKILQEGFFKKWKENTPDGICIDLGEPSVLQTSLGPEQGLYFLQDLLKTAKELKKIKSEKVEVALSACCELAQRRAEHLRERLS